MLMAGFILQDYIYLHKEHNDWITKVQWIPELGLVSSSLDATIKTFDINRCATSCTQ
jgi:WD40 repeat protein